MGGELTDRRRFEIRRCLGAGGFGEVYLAAMVSAGGVRSEVALKVLHQGLDPRSQAVQRLKDEARLLGLLNHPSILKIHDLVLLEDRVTLVTEFVDGADLDQCLADEDPIPLTASLTVVGRVADALNAAWSQPGVDGRPLHLLHRDIKPSNIRVGKHGEVKLLDFGIAKAAGFDREAKTQTNAVVGSFPYMAPERFDDSGDTTASDVYSLGCVLFEAIAGVRLHDEMEVRKLFSLAMVKEKHDRAVEDRLHLLSDAPLEVQLLVREMLAYEPEGRPTLSSLGLRCEDLSEDLTGPSLSRWCRTHAWQAAADEEGVLSGRTITEASISRTANRLLDAQGLPEPEVSPAQPATGMLTPGTVPRVDGSARVGPASAPPTYKPGEVQSELVARDIPGAPEPAPEPAPSAEKPAPVPVPVEATPHLSVDPTASKGSGRGLAALGGLVVVLLAVVGGATLVGGGALAWFMSGDDEVAQVDPVEPEPSLGFVPDEKPDEDPEPVARATPGGSSVSAGGDAAVPKPDQDAVADADVAPETKAALADCSDAIALEPKAMLGKLDPPQRACLAAAMRDASLSQTDRAKLGRVLLVDASARCEQGGGCADFEAEQRYFFEEIDRSDAEMLFKWTSYLYTSTSGSDEQLKEILLWTGRTLENKHQWKGLDHIKRLDALYEIGAKAAYKRFEANTRDEKLRGEAKNRAVTWLNARVSWNKDHEAALKLCASAAGSEEICRKQMFEEKAVKMVTFVSIPVGASVSIDGQAQGDCPTTVELQYGEHRVEMSSGGAKGMQTIEVGSDQPTRYVWRSNEDRWESSF